MAKKGMLTSHDILECMARPIEKRLFISPILDQAQIGDTSVDLRLGHRFLLPDTTKLGVREYQQWLPEDLSALGLKYREVYVPYGGVFTLHPGQSALIGTLEYVGMPIDIEAQVLGRSSVSRLPLLTNTATIHPGFRGVITLALTNMAAKPESLWPGMRVAQMQLHFVSKPVQPQRRSRYDMAIGPAPSQLELDSDRPYFTSTVEPIIIGLVSTIGAGRTTTLAYLSERHGFKTFSLAETIKHGAIRRGLLTQRSNLQTLGNTLRETRGTGYLAEVMRSSRTWLETKEPYVVVDGFKHKDEVKEFRKQRHFALLSIDAPIDIRWQRTQELRRTRDPQSFDEFQALDSIDRGLDEPHPHAQQVDRVIQLADHSISNDGTMDEFHHELNVVVQSILYPS